MSQYIHFFAKSNHDDFIQIDCFSRSNAIYQITNQVINVPYESISQISKSYCKDCQNVISGYIINKKETIANYNKKIDIISKFNNAIEEKITAIDDCLICIEECEQWLDELQYAENFFITLQNIQAPIYVGIDCGSEVTKEDIK